MKEVKKSEGRRSRKKSEVEQVDRRFSRKLKFYKQWTPGGLNERVHLGRKGSLPDIRNMARIWVAFISPLTARAPHTVKAKSG